MWAFNMSLVTKFLFRIIRWTFYCDVYTHAHTQTDTVYTQTHCVHSVYTHTHTHTQQLSENSRTKTNVTKQMPCKIVDNYLVSICSYI